LPHRGPKILSAAALVVGFYSLILRDPIGARLGAIIPPALVVAASVCACTRTAAAPARARMARRPVIIAGFVIVAVALGLAV
jgi:hypothetical protein